MLDMELWRYNGRFQVQHEVYQTCVSCKCSHIESHSCPSSICDCVPRYVIIVPLLIPVYYVLLDLGGAAYPIRFWIVVSGLLSTLLWQEQENWGFQHIVDLVDDDGVYLTATVFNISFNRNLFSDLDQSSITLEQSIIDGFEGSYKVTYVVDHVSVDMIVHSNKEINRVHLEMFWPITCNFFFFVIRSYIFMYDIEPSSIYLVTNTCLLNSI